MKSHVFHVIRSGVPTSVTGFAADFTILHDLLVSKGYISASGSVLGASGSNASSSNPLVVPVKDAQAIWNYKTLKKIKVMVFIIQNIQKPYLKIQLKHYNHK